MRERHTSNKPFSPEELEQLARLEAMSDDDIDTSDIPELPASAVLVSRGSTGYRPVKRPVTIRLDSDIVSWFKDHAGDKPYQSEINSVLRRHVVEAMRRRA
jgi:uncharacterized protein (DUF4415 family)